VNGHRTILVVEDDAELRYVFRTALSFAGFAVREAGDGYDALRIVDQHPPDLVVLDLLLPTISGMAVQQEIAAQVVTRDIPIVIVTGSTLRVDETQVACVLRKPVMPDALVAAVHRCLHSGARGVHF
jgi:CheY-like chemotaxis protein